MITIIIIFIISIYFSFIASYTINNKWYFNLSFLLIFLFLALRYDFGNDYMAYFRYFNVVHSTSVNELLNFKEYKNLSFLEVGFTWLNKVLPNFYLMIALLSLLSCYVYYYCLRTYVTQNLIWISLFILLFNPSLMLIQSSAIRQTIAIILFIYSIKYVIKKNFWKFAILIILGSSFHSSVIILLPLYFILTPNYWNRFVLAILIFSFFFIALFGNLLLPTLESLLHQYFPSYQKAYMNDIIGNPINSGLGFLFIIVLFLIIIWSHNKGEQYNIIISKLSIIGFVIYPLGIYLRIFGRIGMYFEPFIILSLPYAISQMKYWQLRVMSYFLIFCFYTYSFFEFFHSPIYTEKFSIYKINLFNLL